MRNWSCYAALAAVFGLCAPGAVSLAKPPDLPINLEVECPDAQESPPQGSIHLDLDILGGKISLQIQTNEPSVAESVPCLHTLAPIVIDALWRRLLAQAQGNQGETRPAQAREPARKLPGRQVPEFRNPADYAEIQLSQARAMFLIAERCRKKGDLDKARTCYQEAHLLSPQSKYGRQAILRLEEIDAACLPADDNGAAEEQEPGAPQSRENSRQAPRTVPPSRQDSEETRRREMLRSTVPLGLVPYDLITSDHVWTLYGPPATGPVELRVTKPQ